MKQLLGVSLAAALGSHKPHCFVLAVGVEHVDTVAYLGDAQPCVSTAVL